MSPSPSKRDALPTIIDDMFGMFSHATEAHSAGVVQGRDEFYRAAQLAIAQIGCDQESEAAGDETEAGRAATRGFHVAEACNKAIRELKLKFDTRRKTL